MVYYRVYYRVYYPMVYYRVYYPMVYHSVQPHGVPQCITPWCTTVWPAGHTCPINRVLPP